MIKFEHIKVDGFEPAIRGMRNAKNSWDRSDSENKLESYHDTSGGIFEIGPNDQELTLTLASNGPVHAKYRRMIVVYCDIIAPLYWWKEFDTYKVGTVANSCSTMHTIQNKEFTLDDFSCEHLIGHYEIDEKLSCHLENGEVMLDNCTPIDILQLTCNMLNFYRQIYLNTKDKEYWWQMILLLPSSYNKRRTIMMNYEVLANIYKHRQNHRLDEWIEFCKMIESLPYSEIITQKILRERN